MNCASTHRYALRPRKVAGIIKIPPSSPLPTEIVREIMRYTDEDHDLTLVSLISSDWVPVTRSILFEEVVVAFDEVEEFIRLVTSPYCSLTLHVRKLHFRQVPKLQSGKLVKRNFKIFAESVWRIVQLLLNVKWLCLEDFDFHSKSHEICSELYPGLDRIETLVLRRGIFDNLPFAIEEVLSLFPRIRTLQCEWLSHRRSKPTKSQDLTRRPPTNFLSDLVELSFVQPEDGLVAVINSRLSLQHDRLDFHNAQIDRSISRVSCLPSKYAFRLLVSKLLAFLWLLPPALFGFSP
ncbi:hypothetical protein AGABI1DRAFT_132263 [Agaricus bisporus var. burnettii JB137-S8]|uniref:F-box domain-containing protein n=1 Tax=Agaricus bisporus var. burnettii (strain JB137-S8 / ATCC MYA-4627 / FGSC 10392) TaxID=597362 RepID=K5VM23_AGABU|nr:uncharacterized protein AGABI1DRAFT_132263 [Agaricus bisporus var. burnettii JB137-S8]EKM75474.1 hypothetical protein AGABI1DRAFT_132263 [Agaricus bisporus var. burnettii JB137-S8]